MQALLPPTYYHTHFREMMAFVTGLYGDGLGLDEREFMARFARLGEPAQCLYIRMVNRKTAIFRMRDLNYPEIGDIAAAMDQLTERGFVRGLECGDYRACLEGMTKPDLVRLARVEGLPDMRTTWSKGDMVAYVHDLLSYDNFAEIEDTAASFVPHFRERVGFLLYLYFGKLNDNLIDFTLRDLGILSVKGRETHAARFDSVDDARAGYFYRQRLSELKTKVIDPHPLAAQIEAFPAALSDHSQALRNRLLHRLGQGFEARKEYVRALDLYGRAQGFDSQERRIRLLYAQGAVEEVKALLDDIMANPAHDEAYIFADDFYNRKFGGRRTGVLTDLLRSGRTVVVDDLYRGYPEAGAIQALSAEGWRGYHVENTLWPSLFWRVFHDELSAAPVCNDFDPVPKCLRDGRFHIDYAQAVAAKLLAVRDGHITDILTPSTPPDQEGERLWDEVIDAFVAAADPHAVATVLEAFAHNYYGLRDGFPDLLLISGDEVRFVEVKAEGDQIRRNQLARLNLLKSAGFDVEIVRLSYRVDPQQTYVVVDVETTGGRSIYDRVTEIGAVKVRGGKVIDVWQSLINPKRPIPAFITELTGITHDMVRDAPTFDQVADGFAEFMEGAIFVAHNVNFDYGFISAEYRRIGRGFKYPKLCTVASMRKYYPGLSAYGLAPLSREFGIELIGHHRALNDAHAAAGLLALVNEKRMSAQIDA
ncbi:exonuclease domain-containing protein [Asticcacaulis sp. ZE23SCel15]|uniref:exonuclease domain-containing protein n=1 Tax=Asticcacaulis sp. ZE23SCel15 TaxID=3059027 RepID=UPI00265D73EB|nr:exonuclease domain-containing protein [Asticcacaulis sp. ZE23SCel15]WKL57667.1 exonuclease domain-containing protein [Asticcacaulis sp. ZE23SCel15]